ncbi:anti-sigma regulatory factor [Desulfogranum japonicum]|uniref:anti-sigma regulatory factor n=1 Tax=Desulfogranum japonicum TaxID=231447 RepID=UPI00040ED399|nr:anti-sigma regulatory factor [Desulfogranum japonicum]
MQNRLKTLHFELTDPFDNVQVVICCKRFLKDLGFGEAQQYLIASAVSELSTNIIRYAGKGTISIGTTYRNGTVGFVVAARDDGPGIPDLKKAMAENYSSGKGLGLGLPSVKRIMDEFEIHSTPGQGTRVTAIKWLE